MRKKVPSMSRVSFFDTASTSLLDYQMYTPEV